MVRVTQAKKVADQRERSTTVKHEHERRWKSKSTFFPRLYICLTKKTRYKIDDQVITCSLEENKDLMELLERYELQFAQSRHCKQQQLVYWVYYLDVLIQKSTCTSCNDFNEVLFHRVLRGRCDQGQN